MPRPAPRRNRRIQVQWPGWWFGPDGDKALFQRPEDVPSGWKNRPQPEFVAPETKSLPNKTDVIAQLQTKNITINPRWGLGKLIQVLTEATNDD